jgi:hypothetical protein
MAQPEVGENPAAPHASPATDPTNPWHQEARGIWDAAERAPERNVDGERRTEGDKSGGRSAPAP